MAPDSHAGGRASSQSRGCGGCGGALPGRETYHHGQPENYNDPVSRHGFRCCHSEHEHHHLLIVYLPGHG
jgi:hypothetical protein